MNKPKLLIVDDDPEIGTQMKWALTNQYEVTLATDRPSALRVFKDERPQAVCIASLPPGGVHRARSLSKRLRAAVPELRIVVIRPRVADLDEEDAVSDRLREAGADVVARSLTEAVAEVEHQLKTTQQPDEERIAASL